MLAKSNSNFPGFIFIVVLLAAISRLLPHPPNFAPITGMTLFAAATLDKKYWVFIIPMLSLFISDLFLNNIVYKSWYPEYYDSFVWMSSDFIFTLSAMVIIGFLGIFILKKFSFSKLILTSLLSSGIFFLISNIGVWLSPFSLYSNDSYGLMTCLAAGLPFLQWTILGDLVYSGLLVGGYVYFQQRSSSMAKLSA